MGLGLILDSTKDDVPDPYTRGYVLVFSSSDVVVTSWKVFMDMASQGFAAKLTKSQAKQITDLPEVVHVTLDSTSVYFYIPVISLMVPLP
ncbi:hypothetical protein Bca101_086608 [Brassica carinata]